MALDAFHDLAWSLGGAVAAPALLLSGFRNARAWRMVRDLPVSRPGGASVGMLDVAAIVRAQPSLTSHLSRDACAWYRWSIQELRSSGKSSSWQTVASGGDEMAFELEDATGRVRVAPCGAAVSGYQSFNREVARGDPLYHGRCSAEDLVGSHGRRKLIEHIIKVDRACCVIGYARPRPDGGRLEIARDARAVLFNISSRGEDDIRLGYEKRTLLCGALGFVGALIAACHAADADGRAAAAAVYLGAIAVGWLWLAHNVLVEMRQRVHQAWANIDVQLSRRFDLIHELLPLVGALGEHERRMQAMVGALRDQLIATAPWMPGPDAVALAPQLAALAEAYPSLVSAPQYARLHAALVQCEDAIALSRGYYNDIAANWNSRIARVPDCLVAWLFHYRPTPLLQGFDGVAEPAPQVRIGADAPAAARPARP